MRKILFSRLLSSAEGDFVVQAANPVLSVSTDSRNLQPGAVFFAIKGGKFDGHDYAAAAAGTGAAAVVVNASWLKSAGGADLIEKAEAAGCGLFAAADSRLALGSAAAVYLSGFGVPVVAVTGSSGKTTTRRIIETLLAGTMRVHGPVRNFNNDIGVPHTIFGLEEDHDILVLEMGMNHPGEIRYLANIARPDIAVVTNVGTAHIEYFGSRKRIAEAKKEIFTCFTEESTAVINKDDDFAEYLTAGVPGEKIYFTAGIEGMDVVADLGIGGYRLRCSDGREILFSLGGEHNISNLAAGVATARKLGLTESVIAGRIAMIQGVDARTQIVEGRFTIFNDSYNANPDSMRAALKLLQAAGKGGRVAVLGDMFELGASGEALHRDLGRWIAREAAADTLVLAGTLMRYCMEGALESGFSPGAVHWFPTSNAVSGQIVPLLEEGDTVLLKGSRGMRMERILEEIS